jgi:hypothetical protein
MPAYLTYPQLEGSTLEWIDDLKIERSVAGGIKPRAYFTTPKARIILRHYLTTAERDALQAYYVANRVAAAGTITVTFVGDGVTYTCLFGSPPKYTWLTGRTFAEVELLQQ